MDQHRKKPKNDLCSFHISGTLQIQRVAIGIFQRRLKIIFREKNNIKKLIEIFVKIILKCLKIYVPITTPIL